MPTPWNAIYLGHSSSFMDIGEGNTRAEHAKFFEGNAYGSADDPLAEHVLEITAIDKGGLNNVLDTSNNKSDDEISYDLGDGLQTQVFDTVVTFHATLTYTDGTQINLVAGVMQDTSGNLFLVPSTSSDSAMTQAFEASAIQSIELGAVHYNNYSGLWEARHDTGFVCFAAGTLIETPTGPRPVEELQAGDLVKTRDHGPQPILWVGGRRMLARGPGRAYRAKAGGLGPGFPKRDLVLSAQHRVMLRSAIAERMTGQAEVLVPATKLASLPGVAQDTSRSEISYHHILCQRHELVRANGAWCETLLPGLQAAQILGPDTLRQIAKVLPDWAEMSPARPIVDGAKARKLIARHRSNGKPLVTPRSPWPMAGAISNAAPRTARA